MTAVPALEAGDVYVYAHANGAVYVGYADGRSLLLPAADVVGVATGCHEAGCRVVAAWDDAPIATAVVDRIRSAGVPVAALAGASPPHTWSEGTDALMEAAAQRADHLLDDLIARGADLARCDTSGSTALHHAAANGSLHAIDALVAAGADIDLANSSGFTPLALARACREPEAVDRLIELGADPGSLAGSGTVRFRRSHAGTAYVWIVPVAFVPIAAVAFWPLPWWGAAALAAFAIGTAWIIPPRPFWVGGIPRRLDGTVLTVQRPFGPTRTVDLADVTVAGAGGAIGRAAHNGARWLLLGHPDGAPVTRRSLRRLLVAPADLDALTARLDRVVVVPLSGGHHDEVLLPVGNVLSGLGVDLSSSLRFQLERARAEDRAG